jgi:hypothetical protein
MHYQHGKADAILSQGFIIQAAPETLDWKRIHGAGMFICWMVFYPALAFLARYFKTTNGWRTYKSRLAMAVALVVLSLGFLGVNFSLTIEFHPHKVIGVLLFALVLIQLVFGSLNLTVLQVDKYGNLKKPVNLIHRYLGYGIMALAIFQNGLGINILYPLSDMISDRNSLISFWFFYFACIAFWIIAFAWKQRTSFAPVTEIPSIASKYLDDGERKSSIISGDMPKLTWAQLNESVSAG